MKKLMEHNEVLVLILLSLLAFSLCSLMIFDDYNTKKINTQLKEELYATKKQVRDLRERNLELDLRLSHNE